MEEKEKNITNEGLAELIKSEIGGLKDDLNSLKHDVKELHRGMFTPEEKERILAIVDIIDQRLEDETIGRRDITLTREEYDAASLAQGFPNRFALVGETE